MSKLINEPWTPDEIISEAESWSLAGDIGLLNTLQSFSSNLFTQTEKVNTSFTNLLKSIDYASVNLKLARNKLNTLKNSQFIESRVYEDDETEISDEITCYEEELLAANPNEPSLDKDELQKQLADFGLEMMAKYYEKVRVVVSDSEEEDSTPSFVYRRRDLYAHRPLPARMGSEMWQRKWHCGLLDSGESDVENKSESDKFSDSEDEEHVNRGKTEQPLELESDTDEGGSSSSSGQGLEPKIKSFAEQLAERLGNVINDSLEDESEVNVRPIAPPSTKYKPYGGLLSDEPPPLDFKPKSDLFFDEEGSIFDNESDKDECGTKITENKKTVDLFVESGSEEDEGLFRPKKPTMGISNNEKSINVIEAVDQKKPVGGVSLFGKVDLFADNQLFKAKQASNNKDKISEKVISEKSKKLFDSKSKIYNKDAGDDTTIINSRKDVKMVDNENTIKEKPKLKQQINLFDDFDTNTDDLFSSGLFTSKSKRISLFSDDENEIIKKEDEKPTEYNLFAASESEMSKQQEKDDKLNLFTKTDDLFQFNRPDANAALLNIDIFSSESTTKDFFDDIFSEPVKQKPVDKIQITTEILAKTQSDFLSESYVEKESVDSVHSVESLITDSDVGFFDKKKMQESLISEKQTEILKNKEKEQEINIQSDVFTTTKVDEDLFSREEKKKPVILSKQDKVEQNEQIDKLKEKPSLFDDSFASSDPFDDIFSDTKLKESVLPVKTVEMSKEDTISNSNNEINKNKFIVKEAATLLKDNNAAILPAEEIFDEDDILNSNTLKTDLFHTEIKSSDLFEDSNLNFAKTKSGNFLDKNIIKNENRTSSVSLFDDIPPEDVWDFKNENTDKEDLFKDEFDDMFEISISNSIPPQNNFDELFATPQKMSFEKHSPSQIKVEKEQEQKNKKQSKEEVNKLQKQLKINVAHLLPGAAAKPQHNKAELGEIPIKNKTNDTFGVQTTDTLHSITKNRVQKPLNRKPSTRVGRKTGVTSSDFDQDSPLPKIKPTEIDRKEYIINKPIEAASSSDPVEKDDLFASKKSFKKGSLFDDDDDSDDDLFISKLVKPAKKKVPAVKVAEKKTLSKTQPVDDPLSAFLGK